jgi:hypothetical protein
MLALILSPKYLHTLYYNNGSVPVCDGAACDGNFTVTGWVAQQWNARVPHRYQSLISGIATEFDGKIIGTNSLESSISVNENVNENDKTALTKVTSWES